MRVFGYIRFSFMGKSDVIAQQGVDQKTLYDNLYSAERMKSRFHLFEKICLPSILAQTNKNFRVFIAATASMPQVYKDQLDALVGHLPEIEVLYSDANDVSEVFNTKMKEVTADASANTVHFRLDDDDAISCRVVQKLYDYADFGSTHGVIHFPNGIYLHSNGDTALVLREYSPHAAIGFAFVNPPGFIKNPYQCGHVQYPRRVNNVAVADICAFVNAAHDTNDTATRQIHVLNKMIKADPNHASAGNLTSIEKSIVVDFPQFTLDGLRDTICNAAGK